MDACLGKARTQGIGSLPGVVVRDLAVDVVKHVSLRDTVSGAGTDPAHEATKVTEEVTVEG